MGRRGPKPKTPEQLRVIGQRRGGVSRPTCPRHLSLSAQRVWKSYITPLIDAGMVTSLDTAACEMFCTMKARLDECDATIEKEGMTGDYAATGEPGKKSAHVGIANETARILIQLKKELGMTPYARKTMAPNVEPSEQEPAAKYFG